MVETAKRILTKEKIDRQLAGQPSSAPFMSIKDSYNKKVTFDSQDGMEENIERLMTMMSKLPVKYDGLNMQFKPKIFKVKGEDKQEISMRDVIMIREIMKKIGIDQIAEIEEFHLVVEYSEQNYRDRPRYEQNYRNDFRRNVSSPRGNFRGNLRMYQDQNLENRIIEVDIKKTIGMKIMIDVGVGLEKGNIQVILEGMIEVAAVDQDHNQE